MPTITTLQVSILCSYAPGTYDGFANAALGVLNCNPTSAASPVMINTHDPFVKQVMTGNSNPVYGTYETQLANLMSGTWYVNFRVWATLVGSSSPYDEFKVYECWLCVAYDDGTKEVYRPTAYDTAPAGGGTITNPGNAIDGDYNTFATIQQISYPNNSPVLGVTNFVLSSAASTTWMPGTAYTAGTSAVIDSAGHIQLCTTSGVSGASTPVWNDAGGTTPDASVVWTDGGSTACGLLPPVLTITCGSPPAATQGTAYTHTFPVTGGTAPDTFAITAGSLPPGITLNTSTGVVSGTPTHAGTYSFTIQVTDAVAATDSVDCSILVNTNIAITCDSPPNGTTGIAYTHTFPATGGTTAYTFAITVGSLPIGLTLNTSTGVVSGTPTSDGNYPFTIQVTDAISNTASVACSINIGVGLNCGNPPDGTVGVPYSYTFTPIGGTGPFTFSIIAGSLPPGLALDEATGIISGVPTQGGDFGFTIQVTDSTEASAHCTILIRIPPSIGGNVYTLRDYKLTDDDYGQIYPWYVTYFAPTFEQEEALQLGGGRKLLAYLTAFISANSYLHVGCNLEITMYCDTLLNPWALKVERFIRPNSIFDMECGGGSAMGQRIAVKFASMPVQGETDNAFNLEKAILFMKVQARLPIRGSST